MASLPSGTVTLLFTDIEGSSRLWDTNQSDMAVALHQHNNIVRSAIEEHRGVVVKDKGDGYFAAFVSPHDALASVIAAQRQLTGASWPDLIGEVKVRMAIHTGSLEDQDGDYHGPAVNKVARIEGLAHGGQVLLSEAVRILVQDDLADGVKLLDLGAHSLKGIAQPERVYQLAVPGLPEDFPPLVGAGAAGVPLPEFLTSFVGREAEQDAIAELFDSNGHRLITLLGPGGIGKTRLAVETARRLAAGLSGGAFFADLTSVGRAEDVGGVLATAIGAHAEGGASPVALAAAQIVQPTLLVVDNFEHVQSASPTVGELMSFAPDLRVLATSRSPLQIQGEALFTVDPLSSSNGSGGPAPAVRLFYDRAASYGVQIVEAGREADAARAIVDQVDGLPLAIELVAARTRILGVTELADMLQDSLDAVGSGGAERPERQRTIRSTIDWSLGNVSESQRTLFRRLAALPAGGSIKVLRAIAGDAGGGLLDDLAGLVNNSLVRVVPDLPGGTRYRQLVPLREYGQELLAEAAETDLVMDRLVGYYVDRSSELKEQFEFGEEAEKELRVDHDNLLAAMRWSVDHGRAGDLARAFNDFWVYWFNADVAVTAIDWLAAADAVVDSPYMDWFAGLFAFQRGDFETMAPRMDAAMEGFAELGDREALARSQNFAGAVAKDPEEGRRLLEAAHDYFSDQGLGISRFLPLLFLSINSVQQGAVDEAIVLRQELLTWAERAEYRVLIAWSHWNVALALLAADAVDEAEYHAREALAYFVEDRYQEGTASAADLVAVIKARRGDFGTAVKVLAANQTVLETLQVGRWFEDQLHVDATLADAREALGAEAVAQLLDEGRELTLAKVVELVSEQA